MSFSIKKSILRYFPPPALLRMRGIGFEVTPEAIRFIELLDDSGARRVVKFAERCLPASDSPEEGFLEGERIKKAATELKNEFKLDLVRACLPEEKVYLYKTEMPAD